LPLSNRPHFHLSTGQLSYIHERDCPCVMSSVLICGSACV